MSVTQTLLDEYADHARTLSVQDLYREQDRLMLVIKRMNIMRPIPYRLIDLLEQKLLILETLVDGKFSDPKIFLKLPFDKSGTDA